MKTHGETAYHNHKLIVPLPISEDASDNTIVLPLYVPMSAADQDYIISCLKELLHSYFMAFMLINISR